MADQATEPTVGPADPNGALAHRPGQDLQKWLKKGKYLPRFLRDFHDQKEVFKFMDMVMQRYKAKSIQNRMWSPTYEVNWIAAQCYVIDIFLYVMAKHGWTLQRTRQNVADLGDIHETLATYHQEQMAAYTEELKQATAHHTAEIAKAQ